MKDGEEANNRAEQAHGPAKRTLSRIMLNFSHIETAERWAQSNEETHEGQKREAQEPAELESHRQTALSCQTRVGELQRKRR